MSIIRSYTLKEARFLLPQLKEMIIDVNSKLDDYIYIIDNLKNEYVKLANNLGLDSIELSYSRLDINYANQLELTKILEQMQYYENMSKNLVIGTVESIMDQGIVLRDLRLGLFDFPAFDRNLLYYLCWRIDEDDINWWHSRSESFIDRKPITSLIEFI